MKTLLLALLLISSASFAQVVAIIPETALNDTGAPFLRLHNNTFSYVSCYYKDEYNFFTFVLAPQTASLWYPVYGYYEWRCE